MSAVYKPYEVSTDLFYPWLIYYGVVMIPGLVAVGMYSLIRLDGEQKAFGAGFLVAAMVGQRIFFLRIALYFIGFIFQIYLGMYLLIIRLFKETKKKRLPLVMQEFNRIALEPLRERAEEAEAQAEAAAETRGPWRKLSSKLSFRL